MKVIIDVPAKEFGIEIKDKFQYFFKKVRAETNAHFISGSSLLCGAYELETIDMFLSAFKKMQIIPDNVTNDEDILKYCKEKRGTKMEKLQKNIPPVPKCVSAETDPSIKTPNSILLCSKKDDTMLDIAKNVVLAVENTVEDPVGLEAFTTNKNQEVKNRLKELIEYLRIYADWR